MTPRRYGWATFLTGLAISALPMLFMASAIVDLLWGGLDPIGDSGTIAELLFSTGAVCAGIAGCVIVFPSVAWLLERRDALTLTNFALALWLCLAVLSAICASLAEPLGTDYWLLATWLLMGSMVLVLPLAFLWLFLATRTPAAVPTGVPVSPASFPSDPALPDR